MMGTGRNVAIGLGVVITNVALLGYYVLSKIYNSIQVEEPDAEMKKQDLDGNVLFRLIPELKKRIAWLSLGKYPTPISTLKFVDPMDDAQRTVWMKREDLSSDSVYGGNKVRTLEYQIACAKVKCARTGGTLAAVGGSGSNLLVASACYAWKHKIPYKALPFTPEGVSRDNVMNSLSTMTIPGWVGPVWCWSVLKKLSSAFPIVLSRKNAISPPGGNNPTGALGHVGAILELVNQVETGEIEQLPEHIFLAIGSSCTTAGLLAGIALALKLGHGNHREALLKLQVHGVLIHHGAAKLPSVVRWAIKKVSTDVLRIIARLDGADATEELALVLKNLHIHHQYAGEYGAWSTGALLAKSIVSSGTLSGPTNKKPWVCSCFTGKAFFAMMEFQRTNPDAKIMFWQTKSLIQPQGNGFDPKTVWQIVKNLEPAAKSWIENAGILNELVCQELFRQHFTEL